jgi:methionyl-tRNA formyltransferase
MMIGSSRRFGGAKDLALEIIEMILQSPHHLAVVFAEPDDSVLSYPPLQKQGVPAFSLPDSLCGHYRNIRRKTAEQRFADDLDDLKRVPFDLGLSFYSGWLPPSVIHLPRLRFINIHPAPLPMLTGYEAERFHVLTDRRKSWGTIHYLAEKFDTGNILARGNTVELPENMTPITVYEQLIGHCLPVLGQVLDDFACGKPMLGEPQDERLRTYAASRDAVRESVIDWANDTNRKLDCRFRAYCTVNDGMTLHAVVDGQLCEISDIMLLQDFQTGHVGQKIGTYQQFGSFYNAPIIKTLEGAAVVKIYCKRQEKDFFPSSATRRDEAINKSGEQDTPIGGSCE